MDGNTILPTLIKGCLRDKREHQKKLYEIFYCFAHSIVLRYARSKEDASVIINKGFYYAFSRLKEYKETTVFKEWLRSLLIQASIEYYFDTMHHVVITAESITGKNYSNSYYLEKNLTYGYYMKMLHQLPDAYRIVFNLFAIDGYGHERIAKLLDISVYTSVSLLTSARTALRSIMNTEHANH